MNFEMISKMMSEIGTFAFGKNDDGELVTVRFCGCDAVGGCGNCWSVETYQDNGCTRINTYYEDGTMEEMYERGK